MQPPVGEPSGPSPSGRRRVIAAARRCFADRPAAEVTAADVAAAAGVDEAVVATMFRSRRGLERAVLDDLAAAVGRSSTRLRDGGPATFASVLAERRADPVGSRLLIRCALGQMEVAALLSVGNYVNGLIRWVEADRGRRRGAVPARTRLCVFGAMSALLGWISYERFLTHAFGLGAVDAATVGAVAAECATVITGLAAVSEPQLRTGRQSTSRSDTAHTGAPGDVGRVLAETAASTAATFDGARWFDLAAAVRMTRHGSPVARRLAEAVVDDVPVDAYRSEFPGLTALLATFTARDDLQPPVAGGDHRTVFAAGVGTLLGSALWDRPLRHATGIAPDVDLDPTILTFLRVLGGFPDPTGPVPRD